MSDLEPGMRVEWTEWAAVSQHRSGRCMRLTWQLPRRRILSVAADDPGTDTARREWVARMVDRMRRHHAQHP